jgi:tetraacyldisaccharide 4'-kinase
MPIFRILLLPFAFIYKMITDFRNQLYDSGKRKSFEFDRFVISVGNLTVGGTGKTPFVELLIRELKTRYRLAVLSRGYKRRTRGFKLADKNDNSQTLGDEPFQYFTKFGTEIDVAVGEERALAIPQIISHNENIDIIILDDAYQHRSVKPHLNILLNDYNRPFYTDHVMPAGLLRESRKHAKRADMVVVTKCSEEISKTKMDQISMQVSRYTRKEIPVYFSGIKYLKPQKLFGNQNFSENVYLFTGIANSQPLENFIEKRYNLLGHRKFSDHYSFTKKDLSDLIKSFEEINVDFKCLLTTEKDMVRLISMKESAGVLMDYPVFYLPIELYFLKNGDSFASELHNEVKMGVDELAINK